MPEIMRTIEELKLMIRYICFLVIFKHDNVFSFLLFIINIYEKNII